jgi:diguanylate cyclase (GGDEF)-like protein
MFSGAGKTTSLRAFKDIFGGTIRSRIFMAFLAISAITAALGAYANYGITRAGVLVTRTFDETLMSINYARAAAADFAAVQTAHLRREAATNPATQLELDQQIEELMKTLDDDLTIAEDRSQSRRAATAVANVRQAAEEWNRLRTQLHDANGDASTAEQIEQNSKTVNQQIDLLINYTAGDGFLYRQSALAAVRDDSRLNLIGTALALILSALIAWLLAKRVIGPVAAASNVATRIADGDLGVTIPSGGRDELGSLLNAMGTMRDNIRAMMEREISEKHSAQAQLADALENSREGIVLLGPDGKIALANHQAIDYLREAPDLLNFKDVDAASSARKLDADQARLPDGRWLRVSHNETHDGGKIVVYSDITAIKRQKSELQATNLRLDAALDNMSQGLCFFDSDRRLQVVNRRFCEIFDLSPEIVRPGMTFKELMTLSIAVGNHDGRSFKDIIDERDAAIGIGNGTYFQELSRGRVVSIDQQVTKDGGWVITYDDVTEQRKAESRIAYMARHDSLTGLPNRSLFQERIEQAVAQAGRGQGFAVLCIDLDNFKPVNDTLGHPVGDKLLKVVAERLSACVREVDTVARLGGDEFAVVQGNVKYPEDAALMAQRIVQTIGDVYDIDGQSITIGCSVGVSVAPGDGSSSEKLMKNADIALYRAKSDGRGTFRFFEPEMDARLQARRSLEFDLRDALGKNQFQAYYQPIFDVGKGRFGGCEALVRWIHPEKGMIPPDQFISIAEEIGVIGQIGEWMLREACAEASRWPAGMKVAVNVSPVQFRNPQLVQSVRNALAASALPAQRLELEITESVLLANSAATLATLHELRAIGVRIALDDFGTGYSSLSYLRSFPFDKIKIDRSFVRDLTAADGSRLIVRAIINLSKNLGMITTAEGVETEDQLEQLRVEGCDEIQGYLFSRPIPSSELSLLLRASVPQQDRLPLLRAV